MNIIHFDTIDSTNTYSKRIIDELDDKTVVSANSQTAGRGRFTRTWVDLGAENIYMSIILKPSTKFDPVYANLTQYLSLKLSKKLEKFGLNPKIKWPNDVLVNDKKISGILAETVFRGDKLAGIVLGIGVNLNSSQNEVDEIDRPATSLNLVLGKKVDKQEFMQDLLQMFFDGYDEFLKGGFLSIKQDYVKRACFLNQNLSIAVFDKIKKGYSKDLDEFGSLVLVDENGNDFVVNMGEIV